MKNLIIILALFQIALAPDWKLTKTRQILQVKEQGTMLA